MKKQEGVLLSRADCIKQSILICKTVRLADAGPILIGDF